LLDTLHSKIDNIKSHTFEKTKSLMPEKVDIVFFDVKKREQIVAKLKKRIGDKIGDKGDTKKLITNQGTLKYTTTENAETSIDNDKISNDVKWDGLHGVITNLTEQV
jgi:hypothetical protein